VVIVLLVNRVNEWSGLFFGLSTIILVCAWFGAIGISAKRSYKSHKLLQAEIKYVFSSNGIDITSEYGQSLVTWDKIYKVRKFKQMVAIYVSDKLALLIPKKWFCSAEDIAMFEGMVELHILKNGPKKGNRFLRNVILYLIIIIIAISVVDYYNSTRTVYEEISYTQFIKQVEREKIHKVIIQGNKVRGKIENGKSFTTVIPDASVIDILEEEEVDITFEESPNSK